MSPQLTYLRTNSVHPDFLPLVDQLNAYLAIVNGDMHDFYDSHSKTESIAHVLIGYQDERPVACGALRELAPGTVEIKRMFTLPELRGRGLASELLAQLEGWAGELGYEQAALETGDYMLDALALYRKNGYVQIKRYPPYVDAERSVCFGKGLKE